VREYRSTTPIGAEDCESPRHVPQRLTLPVPRSGPRCQTVCETTNRLPQSGPPTLEPRSDTLSSQRPDRPVATSCDLGTDKNRQHVVGVSKEGRTPATTRQVLSVSRLPCFVAVVLTRVHAPTTRRVAIDGIEASVAS
jgi:hypothetical protein